MQSSDPTPRFDPVAFMLNRVHDVLSSRRLEVSRVEGGLRSLIDFDGRPPFVVDLRWSADPGAVAVHATVAGLPTLSRPMPEIQAGFDRAAEQKPGIVDALTVAESEDVAWIIAETRLTPVGPHINATGAVLYEIIVETLARELTRALIVAMLNNTVNVLVDSIRAAGLSELVSEH